MASIFTQELKLYGYNAGERLYDDGIINHFSDKHYIKTVDLIMASFDGTPQAPTSNLMLFQYNGVTGTSDFVQATGEYLDEVSALWQLNTAFILGSSHYLGTVAKVKVRKTFPNYIDCDDLGYDTYYLTNDNLSFCYAFNNHREDSGYISRGGRPIFYKDSGNVIGSYPFTFVACLGASGVSAWPVISDIYVFDNESKTAIGATPWGSDLLPYSIDNCWFAVIRGGFNASVTLPTITVDNMEETAAAFPDPYREGGESETGGGNGDFERTGGSVPIPDLPTLSAADTGFITLFNPTTAQLKNLAEYMWSGGFDVDTFKKIVADPMECILGLSIVPVNIPSGGTAEVKIGNIGTGVSMTKASSQYVVKDCGSLNLKEYWGSYLDYSPYTKVTSLYLPYVGVVSVDSDIIMNKTLGVKYHIDVLSGQCIAYITVNGNVNFQYQGACSVSIPVTSVDYSSMISAGMNIVSSIAGIGAAGAAGGLMMGGPAGAAIGAATAAISAIPSVANNVMQSKPDIKSGGSVGGMGGMMGVQYPFLIIEWPRQSVPAKQNKFTGYPSNIRARLGSLSGYTECDMVIMDKVACTDAERAEIENLLKGGVYL